MNRLENKVCIITGAASGMGLAAVKLFLEEGAKIMAIDRDGEALENEMKAIGSEDLLYQIMNITDENGWKEAVEKTAAHFGKIDILINNAGCSAHIKLMDSTVDLWRTVLEENLIGHWLGIREVVPYMRRQGGGSIVNCCSNTALQGGDINAAAYCSAKGGLRSLTKHAAMALGKDSIRVNAVHPGPILTGLALKYMPDMTPEMLGTSFKSMIPLPPSAGEANDIAYAYLYLASDESKFVTGQDLPVDGGWSAGYVPFQD